MIKIETSILEEKDGGCIIGFNAKDQEGCTKMEGDIADVFKRILTLAREAIITKIGFDSREVLANIYGRTFQDPKDRDVHARDEDMKLRADALMEVDRTMVSNIVQASFLAGMQLCLRLCRNRYNDCEQTGQTDKGQEALVCEGIIRLCQVEIGSGRMPRPQFTKEELEEMDRIS